MLKGGIVVEADAKLRIVKSFDNLLKEKNFNNISVQEIIDNSGVSKSTFYRYFKDKYAIVEFEFANDIKIFDSYIPGYCHTLKEMHKHIFENIYNRRNYYSKIVKIEGQNSFVEMISHIGINVFFRIYREKNLEIPKELKEMTELYCYGFAMLTQSWATQGFKESPEYISKVSYACIPEIIKEYL